MSGSPTPLHLTRSMVTSTPWGKDLGWHWLVPIPPHVSGVTLGTWLNLSEPQCPHLLPGDHECTSLTGLYENEIRQCVCQAIPTQPDTQRRPDSSLPFRSALAEAFLHFSPAPAHSPFRQRWAGTRSERPWPGQGLAQTPPTKGMVSGGTRGLSLGCHPRQTAGQSGAEPQQLPCSGHTQLGLSLLCSVQ